MSFLVHDLCQNKAYTELDRRLFQRDPLWTYAVFSEMFGINLDIRRYDVLIHRFYPGRSDFICRYVISPCYMNSFSLSCKVSQLVLRLRANLLRVRRWGEYVTFDVEIVDEWAVEIAAWFNKSVSVPTNERIWTMHIARRYCRHGQVLQSENKMFVDSSIKMKLFVCGVFGVSTLASLSNVSWFSFVPSYISKRQF